MPMIAYFDDRIVLSVRKAGKKNYSVTKVAPVQAKFNRVENDSPRKEHDEEIVLPFEKWTLPPQPEGYIHYPLYDLY
jgi:hypothetical protein